MPKFSNGYIDGQVAGNMLRIERQKIYQKADSVITTCNTTKVAGESNNVFIKALSGYLSTRKNEVHLFSDNNSQLRSRTDFVEKLIFMIQKNDSEAQRDMLKEENIRRFKGFFTQRLYDILVARRAELQKPTPRCDHRQS